MDACACIYTYIHSCMSFYIYTYIFTCKYSSMYVWLHSYIHMYMHTYTDMYTYIHTCINTYVCTYIHGCSCMPNTDMQSRQTLCLALHMDTYINIYTTHTFLPRYIYNFRINCFCNFQICIFPLFLKFPYFWRYGNLEILEIQKFFRSGNYDIHHSWLLFSTAVLYQSLFCHCSCCPCCSCVCHRQMLTYCFLLSSVFNRPSLNFQEDVLSFQ